MLRRLLTLALAGILVLESPATAYAAGRSVNAVVTAGAAGQYETSAASEITEGLTGENDSEETGGGIILLNRQMRTPTAL